MDSRYTSSTTRQTTSSMPSQHQSPSMAMKAVPAQQPSHARSNSAVSTEPFLKDFTLVAEAAKRAQMAVLMRDFEGIGL
ncbi:hypothetical protein QBC44DRAFT_241843 [Cladorrhinum sp. PSN332]|nr:hypothetical protein QBC44DRAFT_241843 [Cladorrhinum sp. PSN332]